MLSSTRSYPNSYTALVALLNLNQPVPNECRDSFGFWAHYGVVSQAEVNVIVVARLPPRGAYFRVSLNVLSSLSAENRRSNPRVV